MCGDARPRRDREQKPARAGQPGEDHTPVLAQMACQISTRTKKELFPKIGRTKLTDEEAINKFKRMVEATVIPDWYTSLDQLAYVYELNIMEAATAAFPNRQHKRTQ
eukprot:6653288-Pyramimonas_sp.AAC.1